MGGNTSPPSAIRYLTESCPWEPVLCPQPILRMMIGVAVFLVRKGL